MAAGTLRVLVVVWLMSWATAGVRAQTARMPPGKIDALPAFVDATVSKLMERGHVPGASVVIVHGGRVVLRRGYGMGRIDSGQRVDASRTLFRVGSVSKIFAAVAALQLVDAGKLDLQRDVRAILPDIPLPYGATTHQLLTHTSGRLERFAGQYTHAPEHLQPLGDHLRRFLPEQAFRPGRVYSYSNYNTALTGFLVEGLSGQTYADYLADHVFKPLGMTATTARQPPEPTFSGDLAHSYRWAGGRQQLVPFTYTQTGPAGGISTTAADMGRLLLMLLGAGSVDGRQILSPASVQAMLAAQYTPDPRIPARAYEMTHWVSHDLQLLHKDGTLGDQLGVVLLAPAEKFGMFVASNAAPEAGASLGNELIEPLLTHLVGPAAPTAPLQPLVEPTGNAGRFAGSYLSVHTRNEMSRIRELMPMLQSRVSAEPDGSIEWKGRRFVEIEPQVFRSVNGNDHILFREQDGGVELHEWGSTYQRVGWWRQPPFHLGVLFTCLIAFVAYPLASGVRALRQRPAQTEGRTARACAVAVALVNLIFVAALGGALRSLGAVTPLPVRDVVLLSLPLVSLAATVLLLAFAGHAWRRHWWTRRQRLSYSAFVTCAVAFLVFLNYWKLLGVRY